MSPESTHGLRFLLPQGEPTIGTQTHHSLVLFVLFVVQRDAFHVRRKVPGKRRTAERTLPDQGYSIGPALSRTGRAERSVRPHAQAPVCVSDPMAEIPLDRYLHEVVSDVLPQGPLEQKAPVSQRPVGEPRLPGSSVTRGVPLVFAANADAVSSAVLKDRRCCPAPFLYRACTSHGLTW